MLCAPVFVHAAVPNSLLGVNNADALCNSVAAGASNVSVVEGTPYTAWLSQPGLNAIDRLLAQANATTCFALAHSRAVVAYSVNDLVTEKPGGVYLRAPISETANGTLFDVTDHVVTGTDVNGALVADGHCNAYSGDAQSTMQFGDVRETNANWTQWFFSTGCHSVKGVYCFGSHATIATPPTPAPSSPAPTLAPTFTQPPSLAPTLSPSMAPTSLSSSSSAASLFPLLLVALVALLLVAVSIFIICLLLRRRRSKPSSASAAQHSTSSTPRISRRSSVSQLKVSRASHRGSRHLSKGLVSHYVNLPVPDSSMTTENSATVYSSLQHQPMYVPGPTTDYDVLSLAPQRSYDNAPSI